jgi:hypothetical protein
MDINAVHLTGRIYDIGVSPTKSLYPVVEAKLSVNVGNSKDNGPMYDDFNIRSYGKKSVFISTLKEGTFVTIYGKLKEDIRVNADNPNTTRSKTYINIETIKTAGMGEGEN